METVTTKYATLLGTAQANMEAAIAAHTAHVNWLTERQAKVEEAVEAVKPALKKCGFEIQEITGVHKTGRHDKPLLCEDDTRINVSMLLKMVGRRKPVGGERDYTNQTEKRRDAIDKEVREACKEVGVSAGLNSHCLDRAERILFEMWI